MHYSPPEMAQLVDIERKDKNAPIPRKQGAKLLRNHHMERQMLATKWHQQGENSA